MNPSTICRQYGMALLLMAFWALPFNAQTTAATTLDPICLVNPTPRKFIDKKRVIIADKCFHIDWQKLGKKYQNSFIVIRNCEEVVIDNLHITQLNADYLAEFTIIIEDCKKVTVNNSSFKGTCNYHLRIEGCAMVTIENITIAGLDYGAKGVRCGGGIWINNGATSAGGNGIWSPNPKNLENLTIRNCTIKNNLASDRNRNIDGILIHSASNGTLSNCHFSNWLKGDAALDVSHRRTDLPYSNKSFTIEKCVFVHNKHVKSTGNSVASNSIEWINNIYNDTQIGNYHQGWKDFRLFESYFFSGSTFGFWRNWAELKGSIQIKGCLFHLQAGAISEMYKLSDMADLKDADHIQPDFNLYSMPQPPAAWLRKYSSNESSPAVIYNNWQTWQASGKDRHSLLLIDSKLVRAHKDKDKFIPIFNGLNLMPREWKMPIPLEDFYGNPRRLFRYGAVYNASN